MQYWCHRCAQCSCSVPQTNPWVKPGVLKGLNFYMEQDRISTELRTEIYSQSMVMLHLKTKHRNLGDCTSSSYDAAGTAACGYLHCSGGQHSPGLPAGHRGHTRVLWLRETSCTRYRNSTTRWSRLRVKYHNPKNLAPDMIKSRTSRDNFIDLFTIPTTPPVCSFLKILLSQHNIQGRGKAL